MKQEFDRPTPERLDDEKTLAFLERLTISWKMSTKFPT